MSGKILIILLTRFIPNMQIKIKKLSATAKTPTRATSQSNGYDLYADQDAVIGSGQVKLLPSNIAIVLPDNHAALILPRSGLAVGHQITLINSPGLIDTDYRGNIGIPLINHGKTDFTVKRGDRLAQMIVVRTEEIDFIDSDELDATDRNTKGFGSTGI